MGLPCRFRSAHLSLLAFVYIFACAALAQAVPNVRLTDDPAASQAPHVAFDPQGNPVVVWEDSRYGHVEIVWQRFTPMGVPLTPVTRITNTASSPYPTKPDIDCDSEGISHVVWQLGAESQRQRGQMYFCRLDPNGVKTLENTAIVGSDAVAPRVSAAPAGQTDVTWFQYDNFGQYVWYKRLSLTGAPTCSLSYRFLTIPAIQKRPVLATTPAGDVVLYWTDLDFFSYVLARGTANALCSPTSGVGVYTASNEFLYPSVDVAGSMEACAFQSGGDIWARTNPSSACRISSGTHTASFPVVGVDGTSGYLAWQDTRDGNTEIYFSKFSGCTSLTGDIRLTNDPAASTNPDIAVETSGNGHWIVVWQDTRDGNSEIYMSSGNQPFVSAPASVVAAEGLPTRIDVTAADPDGEAISSLTAAGVPPGASFTTSIDQSLGTLTWTPTAQDVGDYTVTFTASNSLTGTAATLISVRPKYEILSPTLDRSVYRIGDGATLAFTVRNNTPSEVSLAVEAVEVQGPPDANSEYPIGAGSFVIASLGSNPVQYPFTVSGLLTGTLLPCHVRIRVSEEGGPTYSEDFSLEFGLTSLSEEEIGAQTAQLDVCQMSNPVGDAFFSVLPCVKSFTEIGGVFGQALGYVSAAKGILDGACHAAYFASVGRTCERDVAYLLMNMTILGAGLQAITPFSGPALPYVKGASLLLSATKCALNLVSQGQIESWVCAHFTASAAGVEGSQTEVGDGSKTRDLLDDVASVSDSLGLPFVAQIGVEGAVTPRLDLGAGWVTTDSTSVDDAIGWTAAPDTLSWFSVGPRVSPLEAGFDTSLATIHAIEPLTVRLSATRAGSVFVGAALRMPGQSVTRRVDHGPVAVDSGAVLLAYFSGGTPLLIDFDGDGTWDEIRYPDGTVLTGADGTPKTGTGREWLRVSPNPAGGQFALRFGVVRRGRVTLRVYDVSGRLARQLIDQVKAPGSYEIRWDGRDASGGFASNGVYYVKLEVGDAVVKRKLVLLR